MEVHREILPNSYLLILTNDQTSGAAEHLSHSLRLAGRSGKPSVWVDCSHLPSLSFTTLRVLVRYYRRLQRRHISLVLCHLGGSAHQLMAKLPTSLCPPVVPSLLDAERYCQRVRTAS